MKICLVTAFPPSHERINEYGYHLAAELQRDPFLSVTVLADEMSVCPPEELPEFDVIRCWKPGSLANPLRLLRVIREIKPDVVWFNLVFSTFGVNPLAAFIGLCAPALMRLAGYSTHVTLHHLMETVSLSDSGVKYPRLYRAAGWIATRLLLMANSVTVLLPAYRRTLVSKYRGKNVHLRAHGIFAATPQFPDFSRRGDPPTILAFGKWGTYKRLEILIEAFEEVRKRIPEAKLVIAGENHPLTPGYVESVAERCRNVSNIEVTGYVPEESLPGLFRSASLLVMPYTSAGGSSGVAHQACQFGLPIVSADISDFRDMAQEEGIAIAFYRSGDHYSLADELVSVLQNPERQREMAEQNFSAALRLTMPQIMRRYLSTFNFHVRARALLRRTSLRGMRLPVPRRLGIISAAATAYSYPAPGPEALTAPAGPASLPLETASTAEISVRPAHVLEIADRHGGPRAHDQRRCSIILPVFNEAFRIAETIRALSRYAAQQRWAAEIVVIDDASTDGTAEQVRRCSAQDSIVRLVRNQQRRGFSFCVRQGVLQAGGDYLLVIADGEVNGSLKEARKLMRALDEGADIAFGWLRPLARNGKRAPGSAGHYTEHALTSAAGAVLGVQLKRSLAGWNACTRAAAVDIFNREGVRAWSDAEVMFLARKSGLVTTVVPLQPGRERRATAGEWPTGLRRLAEALRVRAYDLANGYAPLQVVSDSAPVEAGEPDVAA